MRFALKLQISPELISDTVIVYKEDHFCDFCWSTPVIRNSAFILNSPLRLLTKLILIINLSWTFCPRFKSKKCYLTCTLYIEWYIRDSRIFCFDVEVAVGNLWDSLYVFGFADDSVVGTRTKGRDDVIDFVDILFGLMNRLQYGCRKVAVVLLRIQLHLSDRCDPIPK